MTKITHVVEPNRAHISRVDHIDHQLTSCTLYLDCGHVIHRPRLIKSTPRYAGCAICPPRSTAQYTV